MVAQHHFGNESSKYKTDQGRLGARTKVFIFNNLVK